MKFHQVLEFLINKSDMKNKDIAKAIGLPRPNYLSMLKKDASHKVPLKYLPRLADTLGVNKKKFFELALSEYDPELLAIIKELYEPDAEPGITWF